MSYEIFCACNNIPRNTGKFTVFKNQTYKTINFIAGLRSRARSRSNRFHYTKLNGWHRLSSLVQKKYYLIKPYATLGYKLKRISRRNYTYRGIT